jgi:hypothetical protein
LTEYLLKSIKLRDKLELGGVVDDPEVGVGRHAEVIGDVPVLL